MKITQVVATTKPRITCKQVTLSVVPQSELEELRETLISEGYSWPRSFNGMNYYKVTCEGEVGIGIGPYDGEAVCTNLKGAAESFYLDDSNVKYIPMSYKASLRGAKQARAR